MAMASASWTGMTMMTSVRVALMARVKLASLTIVWIDSSDQAPSGV